jgi:hypothetical protein
MGQSKEPKTLCKDCDLVLPEGLHLEDPITCSNGCGTDETNLYAEKLGVNPSVLLGVDIEDACAIHDWMYLSHAKNPEIKASEEHRKYCDELLLTNMHRILDHHSKDSCAFMRWIRREIASLYYEIVRKFGSSAYWTTNGEKP